MSLGEIAYNAYCESRNWKSSNGEPLPSYESMKTDPERMDLIPSWEASAAAVNKFTAQLAFKNQKLRAVLKDIVNSCENDSTNPLYSCRDDYRQAINQIGKKASGGLSAGYVLCIEKEAGPSPSELSGSALQHLSAYAAYLT